MRQQYGPYSYTRGVYAHGAQTPLKPRNIRITSSIPIVFGVVIALFCWFMSWVGFRTARIREKWERENPEGLRAPDRLRQIRKGLTMPKDHEKAARDAAATSWHHQAVAAGETERMLVRAVNGELVSYLPEEYGNARMTYGNSVTSVGANWVLATFMLLIGLVAPIAVFIATVTTPSGSPVIMWFLPIMGIPGFWYFSRSARRETLAVRLRRERGLPAPTSQTVESKWARNRPPSGR